MPYGKGNINSSKGGSSSGGQLVSVKVMDTILDLNHPLAERYNNWDALGLIFYIKVSELVKNPTLETNLSKDGEGRLLTTLDVAKPLFSNTKQYPLRGEIVLVGTFTGKDILKDTTYPYYIPSINIWNHPHHNALPNPDVYSTNSKTSGDYKTYSKGTGGLVRHVTDGSTDIPLGGYFKEQMGIKPLLPFEGDHIIEGRFGNSIRLGATAPTPNDWSSNGQTGDPITIIRNGQSEELDTKGWEPTIEDINRDNSSIYLTSTQILDKFIPASTNWQSWGAEPTIVEDPIVALTSPPAEEIVEAEEVEIIEEEENAPTNVEKDEVSVTQEEISEEEAIHTSPTSTEETDELSLYDELIESGDYDEDDFEDEVEMETELQQIGIENNVTIPEGYSSISNLPAYSGNHTPTASSFRSNGELDVNMMIGKNFTLAQFIYSRTCKDEGWNNMPGVDEGYNSKWTEEYIMRNLINLAENCVDVIFTAFPTMRLTSGFRCKLLNDDVKSKDSSHHPRGCAVDFQVPNTKTSVIYNWCMSNLPAYAQVIWEFPERESASGGSGSWIHVAYDSRNRGKQTLASTKSHIHNAYGNRVGGSTYQHGITKAYQSYV